MSSKDKKRGYFSGIFKNRKLIMSLAKNDFKTKYAGSFFGIFWAFVQPTITIFVYWFVFSIGFRSPGVSGYPYIIWLMSGLVPWFYFSEALNGGTNSLIEYNYLVKKVVFDIDVLPLVKLIASIFVHIFFTAIVFLLCWFYGFKPDFYSLQLIYYIFCMFVMLVGICYLTSAIVCFFKDLTQIINIILQVGIWMTPIMWDISGFSATVKRIFMLNPLYYIVDGFRDALLYKRWFVDKPLWTIYFWVFTVLIFVIGRKVFSKLRIHFADVL